MHTLIPLYEKALSLVEQELEPSQFTSGIEQLVTMCHAILKDFPFQLSNIDSILKYVVSISPWEKEQTQKWPDQIIEDLEVADKQYAYRPFDDQWEVYSLTLNGEVERKGVVETEYMAKGLLAFLAPLERKPAQNTEQPIQALFNGMTDNSKITELIGGEAKDVTIHLSTITRETYSETISVPVDVDDTQLTALVSTAYENISRDFFCTDETLSEKGKCSYSIETQNQNCLQGMNCPHCHALGPFKLTTNGPAPDRTLGMSQSALSNAVREGEVPIVDYMAEWSDNGPAVCLTCQHEGLVIDFSKSPL